MKSAGACTGHVASTRCVAGSTLSTAETSCVVLSCLCRCHNEPPPDVIAVLPPLNHTCGGWFVEPGPGDGGCVAVGPPSRLGPSLSLVSCSGTTTAALMTATAASAPPAMNARA